ncbi:ABC transporter permease [Occultella glacieicola]|uniref:ABC transporter permease n=1 Tax=Occultella glacieicola TaxID=2518684 RepID=A0ABY2DYE3_9MICO|nr:ABC transporter permease [Occultella glacieicola]TDE89503.1 ABC transporter permease [Occultella glacieicola]
MSNAQRPTAQVGPGGSASVGGVDPLGGPAFGPPSAGGAGPVDDAAPERRVAAWRLLVANPVTVAAAATLAVVVFVALTAQWIAPYGVNEVDVAGALQPPSWAHPFGTDDLGRDILSRVMLAASTSLQVAVVSVTFAFCVGVPIGIISGYVGGWLDTVSMRVVDVMFAFPVLLLALAIVAILQPGMATTMLAIGIVYTPIFARVARASTLSVRTEPYVQVAQTMGTPWWRILRRHVLPNITGPLIVQTSLSLAFAILSEAALSFLGLGIQPPQPSWGGMLFAAQGFVTQAWWMSVFPGLAIFVTVLAFNLLGDGLRDVLDPKQRTRMEARHR